MDDLKADLVLEGGGVKGIGLVGAISELERAGYSFGRVCGTSAGSIVGALIAAGVGSAELGEIMAGLDYRRFRDPAPLVRIPIAGPGLSILIERGIYEGNELKRWLGEILKAHGVETFGDLYAPDPGSDLPPDLQYKLVVIAADLSRGEMVRLPWDYRDRYGLDPKEQRVVDAVRASMSIPIFFDPAKLRDSNGRVATLVDGGVVSNFPVAVFDRLSGEPRWPTFGIKLSARPDARQLPNATGNPVAYVKALVSTMMSGHDQMYIDDPCVNRRTIFVDTFKVSATNFDLDAETARALYASGQRAAKGFLQGWDFATYKAECRA